MSPIQIGGLWYFSEKFKGLELYLFKKLDRKRAVGEIATTTLRNIDINTFGYNYTKKYNDRWEYNSESALQTGYWGPDAHKAYAFHTEARYNTLNKNKYFVIFEYNEASGDLNPRNAEHGTFDNIYPTNHQKYGYMDYVAWQNMKELCIRNQFMLDDLTVKLNLHNFSLKSAYDSMYDAGSLLGISGRRDVTGKSGTDIGREIDLVMAKKLKCNVDVEIGISKLYAGDFIKNTNPAGSVLADPVWSYFQLLKKW